jgi:hypothetical protein
MAGILLEEINPALELHVKLLYQPLDLTSFKHPLSEISTSKLAYAKEGT